MSKRYDSPVKTYPGYIVLPEYLGWEELDAWDVNITHAAEEERAAAQRVYQEKAALCVVSEWHIDGLPEHPEKLPANKAGARLLGWIIGIVSVMINKDDEIDPFLSGASGDTSKDPA